MPQYATNKKAHFEYEILDIYEAGFVLTGEEVKSIRAGHINMAGAFVTFHNDEAFISNLHISKYKNSNPKKEYEPERTRKLLLSHKEINYLRGKNQEKGLTIVPLSVYTKGPYIKVEIGLAKGKKLHDKRKTIQDREEKRTTSRALKGEY